MRRFRFLAAGFVSVATVLPAGVPTTASAEGRVVILGFDGADARLTEEWLAGGELPNLARLREAGAFRPLLPTNPPQTPVAWSTFATGLDPGGTEIFDFLSRIPGTYYPDFALMTPSKERFLWGGANPLLAALAGLAAGTVVGLVVLLIARRRGRRLVLGATAVALVAAIGSGFLGARLLPEEIPKPINHRKGLTFWDHADAHGVKSRTIRVPTTFPASRVEYGTFLSGLGVPDIRGRIGTPSIYTSRPVDEGADNEFSLEIVEVPRRGRVKTEIFGPQNLLFHQFPMEAAEADARRSGTSPDRARAEMEERLAARGVPRIIKIPLDLEITDESVTIGVEGETHTLRPGEWSGWVSLSFPFNAILRAHGIGRFKLEALHPDVHLYFSPVHIDPHDPPPFAPISHPPGFSSELADAIGPYKTMGWSIDTWSLQDEQITEETFLEDVEETIRQFERMFDRFILDEDVRLYTQIFYFTDRVQHMLWRLRDEQHPHHDAEKAARYGPAILDSYRKMDEIVGKAMAHLGPEDALIVLSDHGFVTWRRAVNLNTWLVRNGYMTLTGEGKTQDLEALFGRGDLWPNVDWSRTKAFALGLGYIYLNVLGREPEGTVLPGAEYEAVRNAIVRDLEAFVDPKNGERPVSRVRKREEMYRPGFDDDLIPDLRVCNNPGYRVSWQSSLGNTPPEILYDVEKNWSGDHCSVDPVHVKGILFASVPLESRDAWIGDLFPTICELLGIPTPEGLHGRSLLDDSGS